MIIVKELTRCFGTITAVDDISFSVEHGEVLGFLGPNGAGKTTTMRMITGYLEPSEGSISIDGIDVFSKPEKAKAKIGYLPENAPVYRDMHVLAFLKFVAAIRGLKGKAAQEAIERAVDISHLEPVAYQSIDTLSKGYIRRTSFAQAILHDPPILILDEPTDGLDPNQKFEVRSMISEMGKDKAIIISTHILEEVEACCSRAIIIANGKIVANGTPNELKSRSSCANSMLISINAGEHETIAVLLKDHPAVKNCQLIEENGKICRFRIFPQSGNAGDLAVTIANFAKEKQWQIAELATDAGRLDDVFRSITTSEQDKVQNGEDAA